MLTITTDIKGLMDIDIDDLCAELSYVVEQVQRTQEGGFIVEPTYTTDNLIIEIEEA